MNEIKTKYRDEKQGVDQKVMTTLRQQKNRMKDLECGIEYPQNQVSGGKIMLKKPMAPTGVF